MAYALRAVEVYRHLSRQERAARRLEDQHLRAATSIGANVQEARAAESRKDFAHRHAIALKEARESLYWLKLFQQAGFAPVERLSHLVQEAGELVVILITSITRTKQNGHP